MELHIEGVIGVLTHVFYITLAIIFTGVYVTPLSLIPNLIGTIPLQPSFIGEAVVGFWGDDNVIQ